MNRRVAAAYYCSMHLFTPIVTVTALAAGLYCQAGGQQPGTPMQDESYGLGFVVGEEIRTGLERDGVGAAKDLIAQGFRDGLNGADSLVTRERMDEVLLLLHREMQDRMVRRLLEQSPEFKQLYDANLARSRQFHELFGAQEGVVTLPSGLQYKVLREGAGRTPRLTDTVVINGKVTLLDGTVINQGNGAETRVDAAIDGGIEALQLMRVGSRWQIVVPPDMAHGPGGQMPKIGPNETIVGVIELVAIK